MPREFLLIPLCVLCLIAGTAFAASAPIELGPVDISMNLNVMGDYKIEKVSSYSENHPGKGYEFSYQMYQASISNSSTQDPVRIEVHQMDAKESLNSAVPQLKDSSIGLEHCVRQSALLPMLANTNQELYTIDGREGLLMMVDEEGDEPRYIAAYSPDQENDSGTIVCIISSDLPWDATNELFQSVKTQLV
ncbi:MAG: hypothetical protein LUQ38_00630 [Methanotrichaceae archaeon]|nr:hypothetical protein [Methanotrichaceae archaeon]